jgi:hypothetical protein
LAISLTAGEMRLRFRINFPVIFKPDIKKIVVGRILWYIYYSVLSVKTVSADEKSALSRFDGGTEYVFVEKKSVYNAM